MNPDTYYITVSDYSDTTAQSQIVSALSPDQKNNLILEAMTLIDAHIGEGWERADSEQEFIFPRTIDINPLIPRPITIATRLLADRLIVKQTKGILPDEMQSESDQGYSYSRFTTQKKHSILSDEILSLLDKYTMGTNGGYFGI
jgi:hypothetical protein